MDEDDIVFFEDLVDDAIVAAPRRPEALEFADEWLTQPLGIAGNGPEDGYKCGVAYLVREMVEMTKTFRGDLNFVHREASDVIAQPQPLAVGCFLS